MFAVPGWSVPSAAPKTHTSGAFHPEKPQTGRWNPTSKAARKRKHSNGLLEPPQVSEANLTYLWETVVRKKIPEKRPEVAKKHNKKRRKLAEGRIESLEPDTKQAVTSNTERLGNRKATGRKKRKKEVELQSLNNTTSIKTPNIQTQMTKTQLTPLQVSMKQKLMSARFRHLNEILYTTSSADSLKLFEESPEMFSEYHEGFRRQVEIWPENPVMYYVAHIRQRGNLQLLTPKMAGSQNMEQNMPAFPPLPRTGLTCSIADLGCGEAALSIALGEEKDKLMVKVFNYDLQSTSLLVQKADIANLPLPDRGIDVAILCLALMGTNWIDFIEEAFRILRWNGELWITEIRSRFSRVGGKDKRVDYSVAQRKKSGIKSSEVVEGADDSYAFTGVNDPENSKGETDVSAFIEVLRRRGFILRDNMPVDLSNKMFVKMNFVKSRMPVMGKCAPLLSESAKIGMSTRRKAETKFLDEQSSILREADILKPCVYKLR